MSESQVIAACLRGQRGAHRELYEAYVPYVLTVVRRYGFRADQEADCLQEIFIEVFAALPRYDAAKGALKPWLRTVAVRRLLKLRRRSGRVQWADPETALPQMAAEVDLRDFDLEYLLCAIARLPEGYCTVFNMYEIDGYAHADIAALLGISVASSRSQLSRAKQQLRYYLTPQALNPTR